MPGIFGFVTDRLAQDAAERELSAMLRTMNGDQDLAVGTYSVPAQGCYVGWVAHPHAALRPDRDVDIDDVTVLVAGEPFVNGAIATKQALHDLYERWGDAFVGELNGWFSGVVIDRRRQHILLFNDRYGMQRLYCHRADDSFAFASEAKAILSIRPQTRALDPVALGQFMGFGAAFGDRTLFANISLLPSGSCWQIAKPVGDAISRRRYFQPSAWSEQSVLSAPAFYSTLRETVARVVPTYFGGSSSARVGLSLTGGLDTRLLMAGMPADPPELVAYTYGGVYRDCFDVTVARQVAAACGQQHHELRLGADFFDDFDRFAARTVWTTDGALDLCGTHEVYYSKLARQLSPVRLTGNYGSEILRSAGTAKYVAPPQGLLEPSVLAAASAAAQTFEATRIRHPVTFAAVQGIPCFLYGRLAAAQSELTLRTPYMDNELVALMHRAPPSSRRTNDVSLRLIAELNPSLAAIPTDMGFGGRASRSVTRVRAAYRYLLFKAEWYYNAGLPQWAAWCDAMWPLNRTAPFFLGVHKIDHYRLWFRDRLRAYVRDMLADARSRSRPYLNAAGYRKLVDAHDSGTRNCMRDLNKIMTLELIQRVLIEHPYAA